MPVIHPISTGTRHAHKRLANSNMVFNTVRRRNSSSKRVGAPVYVLPFDREPDEFRPGVARRGDYLAEGWNSLLALENVIQGRQR